MSAVRRSNESDFRVCFSEVITWSDIPAEQGQVKERFRISGDIHESTATSSDMIVPDREVYNRYQKAQRVVSMFRIFSTLVFTSSPW
jgi:hypothetical protein